MAFVWERLRSRIIFACLKFLLMRSRSSSVSCLRASITVRQLPSADPAKGNEHFPSQLPTKFRTVNGNRVASKTDVLPRAALSADQCFEARVSCCDRERSCHQGGHLRRNERAKNAFTSLFGNQSDWGIVCYIFFQFLCAVRFPFGSVSPERFSQMSGGPSSARCQRFRSVEISPMECRLQDAVHALDPAAYRTEKITEFFHAESSLSRARQ